MILKRYVVNNMQEVMEKAKKECGDEAIILNTKPVRKKGLRGLFSKAKIEVLVAYDEVDKKKDPDKVIPLIKTEANYELKSKIQKGSINKDDEISSLKSKISNIDLMLNSILEKLDDEKDKKDSQQQENGILSLLLAEDVKDDCVKKIAECINKLIKKEEMEKEQATKKVLENFLGKGKPIRLKRNQPTVILFLGTTGVGKTTTLAKLATMFVLQKNKKVSLITTDTYKMASSEQLKTYSEIMDIPLSITYSNEETKKEVEKYSDKDIIFIDTGKCPDEEVYQNTISQLIEDIKPDEIFIVISAHSSYKSLVKTIETYSFIKTYKFIITKMDEAMSVGPIFNIRSISSRPISYLTFGQVLTEDIEVFNPPKIIDGLLR